ncbi:MAG: protein kinase [Longimicrobiales bacterium]|nr:protein kinase [Longimicrobiales bacterium]
MVAFALTVVLARRATRPHIRAMPDVPSRLAAALADRYAIARKLGEGGMATVYLADDLKHDRKVAIKVLKPELAAVVGGERFLAEIRTTANLQHPHILPLFDSGEADGFLYYVMPYVEGESLRGRLDRERQLPVAEAVGIAVKVAGALQAAHARGIVHRDIKPANLLMQGGEPLIADFGIALAVSAAGGGRLTETGLSLGTPYYMSPEQATADRDPDARSDVYSLACVLFEMLVGDPPFTGSSAQAVLGRILTQGPPSVTAERPSVPPHVDAAIHRALQKLPADRFEGVAAFARALADENWAPPPTGATGARPATGPGRPGGGGRGWLPWGVAAAAVAVALAATLAPGRNPSRAGGDAPRPLRFALEDRVLATAEGRALSISNDGRVLAYQRLLDGRRTLFVRDFGSQRARPVPRSEDALFHAVSPDGRWLAYGTSADSAVQRVAVSGGATTDWVRTRNPPMGLSWNGDDEILLGMLWFDGDFPGLMSATLGDRTLVERAPGIPDSEMHHEPYGLPGGEAALFVYFMGGQDDATTLGVFDLTTDTWRAVDLGGAELLVWNGVVGVSGDVLLFRELSGRLMAVGWDAAALRTVGVPAAVPGAPERLYDAVLAHDGTLAMIVAPTLFTPVVVNDRGDVVRALPLEGALHFHPRLSPDRAVLYVESGMTRRHNDWFLDLRLNTALRVDIGDRATNFSEYLGSWSGPSEVAVPSPVRRDPTAPDTADAGGGFRVELLRRSVRPGAVTERYVPGALPGFRSIEVSPDGRWGIVAQPVDDDNDLRTQLAVLDMDTGGSRPFLGVGGGTEFAPRFSPDGRWVAFVSTASGRAEVYVRPFPGPGSLTRVSEASGGQPVWDPDGVRLYFRTATGLSVARLRYDAGGAFAEVVAREPLFEARMFGDVASMTATYDVLPEGFVLAVEEGEDTGRILVWKDWLHEVRPLLGGGG